MHKIEIIILNNSKYNCSRSCSRSRSRSRNRSRSRSRSRNRDDSPCPAARSRWLSGTAGGLPRCPHPHHRRSHPHHRRSHPHHHHHHHRSRPDLNGVLNPSGSRRWRRRWVKKKNQFLY